MKSSLINSKLHQLAIKNRVPAWSVYMHISHACLSNENIYNLQILSREGRTLFSVAEDSYKAWDMLDDALRQYAQTEECQKEWARYCDEGMPCCGLFGAAL
ncbi:TPA: hypothetical protein OZR92_003739 [Escherichia coli]|nr:hypothetical protein [Escherichia coli]